MSDDAHSVGGLEPSVTVRLQAATDELRDLELRLGDPDVLSDADALRSATERYRELEPLVDAYTRYRSALGDRAVALELAAGAGPDDRADMQAEAERAARTVEAVDAELRELLIPPDPHAGKAVIVEIRGAEGGEEANLFARDLYEMYRAYADRRGWQLEVLSSSVSDLGGFDAVTFEVRGRDAWTRLKYEGGPHRVQRVPVTESQGRIHTSAATVAVLPEADEVSVDLDERDLEIDVHRSSGPGGQSVNTTDSAVRITHVPTGIVVSMQDERSQLQNRDRAMRVLRARLFELAERTHADERSADRRAQIGGGGRSEKIRTYNFKENRVTDHRIGLTSHRLADVLAGDLDLVVDALVADDRARQVMGEASS